MSSKNNINILILLTCKIELNRIFNVHFDFSHGFTHLQPEV